MLGSLSLTPNVYRARADRLGELIRKRGLDAVVVFSAPSMMGTRSSTSGSTLYLADWQQAGTPTALVLTADNDAALFGASNLFGREWANVKRVWVERRFANTEPVGIRRVLDEAGLAGGRIGLLGRAEMSAPFYQGLVGGDSHFAFEDADDLLVELKRQKDQGEIELGRRAVENGEAMLAAIVEGVRKGKKVYEIAADAHHAGRYRGSDWTDVWIGPGSIPTDFATTAWQGDHRIEDGGLVQVMIYHSFNGRYVQQMRTGAKGKASPELKRWVDVAVAAQDRALEVFRPGCSMLGAVQAVHDFLDEAIPLKVGKDPSMGRNGHLQGVQYAEPGDSDPFRIHQVPGLLDDPRVKAIKIFDGMRVVIHPNFSVPGLGWVGVGDNILVGSDGADLLGEFPRQCFEA
jgi:Xaa-Pro dipeptidase